MNYQLKYLKKVFYIIRLLKGTRGVRLDNRTILRAPGPRTKYLERLFCRSMN